MSVFAVLSRSPEDEKKKLAETLERLFPGNYLTFASGQWIVSTEGTAKELSDAIGMSEGTTATGIVATLTTYYGREQADIWEWIAARLKRADHASQGKRTNASCCNPR